jgi:hypothetical protein
MSQNEEANHIAYVTQRQTILWVAGVILTTLLVLGWGIWGRAPQLVFDDAYITYRYADHFRQGLGLVYNPGQWVLGTTTPLFSLILGTIGLFVNDLEWLGYYFGLAAWLVTAWMTLALFWELERPWTAATAAILIALQPAMLISLGMETPLVLALMVSSAWAWLSGRWRLAVILLAALILTRQDGALWAAFLGLEVWRRQQRLPWREAVLTTLLVSPWIVYAQWRYGSFLPNSANAKIGQINLMPVGNQNSFFISFWDSWSASFSQVGTVIAGILLLASLFLIWYRARELGWLAGWLIAYVAVYTALNVASFPWYFTPPIAVATLLLALPLGYLLGDRGPDARPEPGLTAGNGRYYTATTAIICVLILLGSNWQRLATIQQTAAPGYNPDYRPAALWLAENAPPQAQIATIEIGVIGYFSQRPILDTMGLVSPEMTNHLVGWTETVVYATQTFWPDYAVVVPNTAWDWLLTQWWFAEFYEPVATFERVVLYQRVSQPEWPYYAPAQATFSTGFAIAGIGFKEAEITPGQLLDIMVDVSVSETPSAVYQFTAYFIDNETDQRLAAVTTYPFSGGYNSNRWQPEDRLSIPLRLSAPPDLQPGSYRLGLLVYDTEQGRAIPHQNASDPDHPEVVAGWLRWGTPSSPQDLLPTLTDLEPVLWENGIQLNQLAIPHQITPAAETVAVQLTWQTRQTINRDLTLFLHLVDETGALVAQLDRRPFYGRFPTAVWAPGEQLTDQYDIPLPDDLPVGAYSLRLGFYDLYGSNGRIPIIDPEVDYLLLPGVIEIIKDDDS